MRATLTRRHEVWRARRSELAHAHLLERPLRTICGAPGVELRYAWPTTRKCPACVVLMEVAPIGR